jgi:hypothetical protein
MHSVIAQAIRRLRNQGMTPRSPCDVDVAGQVRLCTAAAVAAAGLEQRFGAEASQEFERQLLRAQAFDPLYDAFARLAFPRSLCETLKIYNDSVAPERRREAVIEFLGDLPEFA